jgi:hypothetical protein
LFADDTDEAKKMVVQWQDSFSQPFLTAQNQVHASKGPFRLWSSPLQCRYDIQSEILLIVLRLCDRLIRGRAARTSFSSVHCTKINRHEVPDVFNAIIAVNRHRFVASSHSSRG